MKNTHYDTLQVSPKANLDVIKAAYAQIKPTLLNAVGEGNEDARNQLLFLDEAYAVLSSPEKRAAYDQKLSENFVPPASSQTITYFDDAIHSPSWSASIGGKIVIAGVFFAVVFSVYKFVGQRGEQKNQSKQLEIQAAREIGSVQNDSYRAETERNLAQGSVQNQDKLIDKSYEIAARETERRKMELEYRANAGTQQLEMQRQRQEAMLQEQRWRQEQYEKDRQAREAKAAEKAAADAPKRQLCNMYALNGNFREAREAGCNRL